MTSTAGAPLRYGLIGTGMMGVEHLRNIAALDGADVVAVADPDDGSMAEALRVGGSDVNAYRSTADMLADEQLDAVVVSTPNHTHRSVLDELWATDLHVMVEKPLCTTVADALAVRDAARRHSGVVWVGLEYRYMPPVRAWLDEIESGSAGRLHMVSIREHRFPFLVKVGNWNRFTANTGGTLVEKCCHFFDLMRLATQQRPVRVFASGGQAVNHLNESYDGRTPDVLDHAFVTVEFDGGIRALLDLCMFAEGSRYEQELVAVGDAGKVEVGVPGFMEVARGRPPTLAVGSRGDGWPVSEREPGGDDRIRHTGAHHGASYLEHVAFADAIRSGARPSVGVDDGVWSVAMGVAAHRSIDEGRPVDLDELGLPDDLD